MSPMMKLQSQHAQVVIATPLARRDEEWTSAAMQGVSIQPAHSEEGLHLRIAQGRGDHPTPKVNIKIRIKATATQASL